MNFLRASDSSHTRFGFPLQGSTGVISLAAWLGFFCVAALILAWGCGRKGNPLPPLRHEPAAIKDLRAENQPDGILLSWSIPQVDGRQKKIQKIRVLRAEGAVSCKSCPGKWTLMAEIHLDSPSPTQRRDGRIQYLDSEVSDGKVYQYRIISVTKSGGMSPPSNTVQILREES